MLKIFKMKNLKISYCILLIFTLFCCSTNEEQIISNPTHLSSNRPSNNCFASNNPLMYKWHLYHLHGGIAGFNEYYSYGQVTWKFSYAHQNFTVFNFTNSYPTGGYIPTGVYPCTITTYPDGNFCFSSNYLSGCTNQNSNILYLSEEKVADGIHLMLVH